jgi:Tol biopolymer transport system component
MRRKEFDALRLGKPRRLTGGLTDHEQPTVSPDGHWLAYHAGVAGSVELLVCDTAGRLARRASPFSGNSARGAWRPDGARLVYAHQHFFDRRWELWETALVAGGAEDAESGSAPPDSSGALSTLGHPATDPREVLANPHWDCLHPAYSPDGSGLVYCSDEDNPGRFRLWQLDLESGARRQLTFGEAQQHRHPAFSPDGKRIAFEIAALAEEEDDPAAAPRICELDLPSGEVRELSNGERCAHPQFLTDNVLVCDYTPFPGAPSQLAALHLRLGELLILTSGKSSNRQPYPWVDAKDRVHLVWAGKQRGKAGPGEPDVYEIFVAPFK